MKITEKDKVQDRWYEEAKTQTIESLPVFMNHLVDDYEHDYGTICHAVAAAGIAAMCAVDHDPKQGGITGFQAGAIMWKVIRHWYFESNKTGLRLIDYDDFLYPQYEGQYQKTITASTWECIQKRAKELIEEADTAHVKYLVEAEKYKEAIAIFVEKYPDYYQRREHYDHLRCGTGDELDAYHKKESDGFEFAPQEPYEPINSSSSRVYQHWQSISAGIVPFGYEVDNEQE